MRTYVRLGLLLAVVVALAVLASRGTPAYAWSDPAALNTNAATDSGHDRRSEPATDGAGNWVTVWESDENLGGTIGTDYDILVSRSADNGATWTGPVALNTNAATDSGEDYYAQVTTDDGGNWVAVWASRENLFDLNLGDYIGTDPDALVSRSTDNGVTWSYPAALNTNAATDSGEDLGPHVAPDGGGNWAAVWCSDDSLSGTIGTDLDILYATEYVPPYPPVGGIAELPDVSGSAGRSYVALAGLAAAAVIALGAGGWYARRRWLG